MAKFDAGTAVERLEYDFTAYGGGAGNIHEPTTKDVNRFFKQMKGLMKDVNRLRSSAEAMEDVELENMDDDALAEKMASIDKAEEGASEFQGKTIEYLAELCGAKRDEETGEVTGGEPSIDDLRLLPYRVLQAFSAWLMEEIKPKRTTPGTKR